MRFEQCVFSVQAMWNTIQIVRSMLNKTSAGLAEWFIVMQPDTLVDDPAFTFPFEMYAEKHVVAIGNTSAIALHEAHGLGPVCSP